MRSTAVARTALTTHPPVWVGGLDKFTNSS